MVTEEKFCFQSHMTNPIDLNKVRHLHQMQVCLIFYWPSTTKARVEEYDSMENSGFPTSPLQLYSRHIEVSAVYLEEGKSKLGRGYEK